MRWRTAVPGCESRSADSSPPGGEDHRYSAEVRCAAEPDRIFWLEDGHLNQIEHGSMHQRPK